MTQYDADALMAYYKKHQISRRTMVIGGAVVVVAGATGAYFALAPGSQPEQTPQTTTPTTPTPTPVAPVPQEKRKIVVALIEDIKSLNSVGVSTSSGLNTAYFAIHDTLFHLGPPESDGLRRAFPQLAVSAENVDGDLSTTRFKLRPNVRFHDGTPLTAEALVNTVSIYNNKPSRQSQLRTVTESTVEDDLTITMKWKNEDAGNLLLMKNQIRYGFPKIYHPTQTPEDVATNPIGTGPYKVKEFAAGVRLVLERNTDYFGDTIPDSEKGPYFTGAGNVDEVAFVTIKQQTAALTALQNGDVDLVLSFTPEQARSVKQNPDLKFIFPGPTSVQYIHFNSKIKPFDDLRVRLAASYATDKDKLLVLYEGLFEQANGLLPPGVPGYDPAQTAYPFDLDKAKSLMAEAGLADGFDTEIFTAPSVLDPARVDMAQAFAAMMGEININMGVQTMEPGAWSAGVRPPDSKFPVYPFALGADTLTVLKLAVGKTSFLLTKQEYPEIDALLDKVAVASEQERDTIYRQINALAKENATQVFLAGIGPLRGATPRLDVNQWEREVHAHVYNFKVVA